MLAITNLSKIYKAKNKSKKVIAVDNISLNFPDKGLVFVTGRSGSGKSTLLNQIGALDKPTKGKIIFNNLRIDNLNERDAGKYRNDYVGFVFQDFALIESMSVYDNVAISLELKKKDDLESVDSTLKELDIYNLKDKKVTELSAGQKQRVAIARALVKKPKLILADEPTGNLDKDVGGLVLNFLKKVSKSCLVIIISHNQDDAFKYGDRIIKLSEGKVVEDVSTNFSQRDKIKIGKTIYLNDLKTINDYEFNEINKEIYRDEILSIRPVRDLFGLTNNKAYANGGEKINLSNDSLTFKKVNKLYKNFLSKNLIKSTFLSMASMILISIFSLCVMLINFDSSIFYENTLTPTTCLIKNKYDEESSSYNQYKLGRITSDDEKIITKSSDYYYIYNLAYESAGQIDRYIEGLYIIPSTTNLYSNFSFGIAVLDETQYKKIFDFDKIEYLCEADEYKDWGIYITDYLADTMNYYNLSSYEDLVGKLGNNFYINGIIKTNYLTKFKEEFDKAKSTSRYTLKNAFSDDAKKADYLDWVHNYYDVSYTFNANFVSDYSNSTSRSYYPLNEAYLEIGDEFTSNDTLNNGFYTYNFCVKNNHCSDIQDNEVVIPSTFAREVLGQGLTIDELNSYFEGKNITLHYQNLNGDEFTKSVSVRVHNHSHGNWFAGEALTKEMISNLVYRCHANIFDSKILKDVSDDLENNGFTIYGTTISAASRLDSIIASYIDLFKFFAFILLIASILFIFYMSYDSVRKKKYDIGVFKAIGLPTKDLYKVYGINIFFEFCLCIIFYVVFVILFKYIANEILVNSLIKSISESRLAQTLSFTIFNYTNKNLIIDTSIILISSIVGALFPIIKIKNIKPIDIVRCKY